MPRSKTSFSTAADDVFQARVTGDARKRSKLEMMYPFRSSLVQFMEERELITLICDSGGEVTVKKKKGSYFLPSYLYAACNFDISLLSIKLNLPMIHKLNLPSSRLGERLPAGKKPDCLCGSRTHGYDFNALLAAVAFHYKSFASLGEALEWVDNNLSRINENLIAYAREAKCPFQFIANILRIAQNKLNVLANTPITQDASASAYQIMSYFLLDETMAKKTNLISSPDGQIQDVYSFILEELKEFMKAELEGNQHLSTVVCDNLTRKIVKVSYFTTVYDYMVMEAINIWVSDKLHKKRHRITLRVSSSKRDRRKIEISTFVNFIHQRDAQIAMNVVDVMLGMGSQMDQLRVALPVREEIFRRRGGALPSMSSTVRTWRMAFLTLRDETLASPPRPTVVHLLNHLIFSQFDYLIAAAPDLPPHEVTSDVMFLLELARNISHTEELEDVIPSFVQLSHLIHSVSIRASLQMNSTSWALVLDSFKRIVEVFLDKARTNNIFVGNVTVIKATKLCLESIRCLFNLYQAIALLSDSEQLLNFLLQVVTCFHGESIYSSCLSDNHKAFVYNNVLEVQTIAFTMIGEVYSRVSSSLPFQIWQSSIEVLSKVMDVLASKTLLVEDTIMAMFYIELLHCLHLLLADPRGSLSGHVAGHVAALRMFFHYGLTNKSHLGSTSKNLNFSESSISKSGRYRPPHLRKKFMENIKLKDEESLLSSDHELSLSSDSDCSDNDGSATDACSHHFAKARLGAIVCIQDLCRADPKLFTAQWTMLLPSSDVLSHRKYGTTLMSCLLYDPSLKVRIAAASTIMAMLDGPASVFLQVAEFRESSKCGSFTALSSSLGHILMQLHSGTLYLIKHEMHSRLLALSFRILMLLISSTPYSRMSAELLSTVISSVQARVDDGFPLRSDRNSLLAAAINCLTVALSVSPSSVHVNNLLLVEASTGFLDGQRKSGVLYTLFHYSKQLTSPSVSLEALQALKVMAHNYPNTIVLCWGQVSSTIYTVLKFSPDDPARSWGGNVEHTIGAIRERVMAAGIKVLDECLRAISGFKGTEDLSSDKLPDSPFTSDYVKTKAVSSAPVYGLESPASTEDESKMCVLASERWSEAIVKHMPIIIQHSSAMRFRRVSCANMMSVTALFHQIFGLGSLLIMIRKLEDAS
ncbi:unnamed protein product [Fraxinus pennsylvanica]|uniref:DNA-directed RNA polymerase n=1 Tax=Fraxinus pennsylvanica TaxID=56036 RepID=A0AAD2AJH7_9LAMI|nr:unnamed protein product [Fraxinus pennsylvanica]